MDVSTTSELNAGVVAPKGPPRISPKTTLLGPREAQPQQKRGPGGGASRAHLRQRIAAENQALAAVPCHMPEFERPETPANSDGLLDARLELEACLAPRKAPQVHSPMSSLLIGFGQALSFDEPSADPSSPSNEVATVMATCAPESAAPSERFVTPPPHLFTSEEALCLAPIRRQVYDAPHHAQLQATAQELRFDEHTPPARSFGSEALCLAPIRRQVNDAPHHAQLQATAQELRFDDQMECEETTTAPLCTPPSFPSAAADNECFAPKKAPHGGAMHAGSPMGGVVLTF